MQLFGCVEQIVTECPTSPRHKSVHFCAIDLVHIVEAQDSRFRVEKEPVNGKESRKRTALIQADS